MTVTEWMRTRLKEQARLPAQPDFDMDEWRRTEWHKPFERLMRNRLLFGAMRYGRLGDPDKPQYDRVADMIKRLEKYRAEGNTEHLVDVANLAMCEFVEGNHKMKHFRATDDGMHTRRK